MSHDNLHDYIYAGNVEYKPSHELSNAYVNMVSNFTNPNISPFSMKHELPMLGNNYFWAGHIETLQTTTTAKYFNHPSIDVYSLYGDKSYGLHSLFGYCKRHANGTGEPPVAEQDVDEFIKYTKADATAKLGTWLNWDKIFYNPDTDYINELFYQFDCDDFENIDYLLNYVASSLTLILEYYPSIKNNKILLGFDDRIIQRVL